MFYSIILFAYIIASSNYIKKSEIKIEKASKDKEFNKSYMIDWCAYINRIDTIISYPTRSTTKLNKINIENEGKIWHLLFLQTIFYNDMWMCRFYLEVNERWGKLMVELGRRKLQINWTQTHSPHEMWIKKIVHKCNTY